MPRTALETVRAYAIEAWSNGRDDWIPELCHDPLVRHDAGSTISMRHAEQRARMRHNYEALKPRFREVVLSGNDEHVTLVWDVTGRDPDWRWCGIEVFRVVDGRIAEVWNSAYADGSWGAPAGLAGRIGCGEIRALAIVRSDLQGAEGQIDGRLVVPAEVRGLSWWLQCLFGEPHRERSGELLRLRFMPGDRSETAELLLLDDERCARRLRDPVVSELSLQWERSGLVNAAVVLSAREEGVVASPVAASSEAITRLAQTTGSFVTGEREGEVVEASVTILADGSARGHVTLRAAGAAFAAGEGRLAFGWRHGAEAVLFVGVGTLAEAQGNFMDGGMSQASYRWHAARMVTTIESLAGDGSRSTHRRFR